VALTARERDVLALVADGRSNAEIADRPHVAVTTVKTHVTSLMAKTGAGNRVRSPSTRCVLSSNPQPQPGDIPLPPARRNREAVPAHRGGSATG
jgi:hypothetical protein